MQALHYGPVRVPLIPSRGLEMLPVTLSKISIIHRHPVSHGLEHTRRTVADTAIVLGQREKKWKRKTDNYCVNPAYHRNGAFR